MMKSENKFIITYHNDTKHTRYQYARSPGFMDWENQPVPFRFYKDAVKTKLPLNKSKSNVPFESLYRKNSISAKEFSMESMGYFPSLCITHYNPFLHELETIAESKTDHSNVIHGIDV